MTEKSKLAAIVNHEKFVQKQNEKMPLIEEWVIRHKDLIENAKLNDLKFLSELASYVGVKDTRSLGKILGVQYKKEIIQTLRNIIKCTPNT